MSALKDDDDEEEDDESLTEMSKKDFIEFAKWLKSGADASDMSEAPSDAAPTTPGSLDEGSAEAPEQAPKSEKAHKFDEDAATCGACGLPSPCT